MNYARLRAIETRTWVARSANTGISCFIDPYGTVIDPQPYDTQAAIKLNMMAAVNNKTFFVKQGDILSKVMIALSILLIGWMATLKIRSRFLKKEINARR